MRDIHAPDKLSPEQSGAQRRRQLAVAELKMSLDRLDFRVSLRGVQKQLRTAEPSFCHYGTHERTRVSSVIAQISSQINLARGKLRIIENVAKILRVNQQTIISGQLRVRVILQLGVEPDS